MSTTITSNDKTVEKRMQQAKAQIFVLSNRRESGYYLADQNRRKIGPNKDSPKGLILANPSWTYLPEGGTTPIRYIKGAPTIFENSLWKDEQGGYHNENTEDNPKWTKIRGLKELGYAGKGNDFADAYKRGVNMGLKFEDGYLNLHKFGGDPVLLEFVKHHHFNSGSPNWRPPASSQFVFHCVNEEKIAETQLLSMDDEAYAAVYITSLHTSGKDKTFRYTEANVNKLNATLQILNLQAGTSEFDYAQKHVAIRDYSKANTIEFVRFIQDAFSEKQLSIGTALNAGIGALKINEQTNEYILVNPDGSEKVLVACTTKDDDDRIEEVIVYLINNPTAYRDLGFAIEAGKQRGASGKKGK